MQVAEIELVGTPFLAAWEDHHRAEDVCLDYRWDVEAPHHGVDVMEQVPLIIVSDHAAWNAPVEILSVCLVLQMELQIDEAEPHKEFEPAAVREEILDRV